MPDCTRWTLRNVTWTYHFLFKRFFFSRTPHEDPRSCNDPCSRLIHWQEPNACNLVKVLAIPACLPSDSRLGYQTAQNAAVSCCRLWLDLVARRPNRHTKMAASASLLSNRLNSSHGAWPELKHFVCVTTISPWSWECKYSNTKFSLFDH